MNPVQRSFGRGEISPALAARVDLDAYKASLSTQRNFITPKSGGVQNRPGTELVGQCKADTAVREIPFTFSDTDAYVLLFGDLTMRVIRNGAFVTESAQNITSITQANPAVITLTAHGYSNNDEVYITTTHLGGMNEIGTLTFIVSAVTADTFKISYKSTGTLVNSTAFTAYVSGGTVARLYTVTTVFSASEVAALDYAQYKDTVVLTHPSHRPTQLTRSGHASWAFADIVVGSLTVPFGATASAAGAGAMTYKYKVSATYKSTSTTYQTRAGQESMPGTGTIFTISNITQANPPVVTATSHGLNSGDTVLIMSVGGMTELNNREFTVQVPSTYTPDTAKQIAGITQAAPMVVTLTAHGYSNGDILTFFSVQGMKELNDITYCTVVAATANTFQVYYYQTTTKIDSTGFVAFIAGFVLRQSPNPTVTSTFQLLGIDSTAYGAYTAGGVGGPTVLKLASVAAPTAAAPISFNFGTAAYAGIPVGVGYTSAGIPIWNLYREINGTYGFIGSVEGNNTNAVFYDTGLDPDTSKTPLQYRDLFVGADNFPSCVAFHQQRLIFANSNTDPQTVWCSRIGDYYNFSPRQFITDDDGVTFTIAGTSVDPVRHLVPARVLLCMSQSSEVVAEGIGSNTFVPGGVSVHQDSYAGSGTLKPILVNSEVVFTQKDLRILRNLAFNFQVDSYTGDDVTVWSAHLFKGYTIIDMAYQKSPNSIIWLVREDGALISCTYIKEQSIFAFARHDTLGDVKKVCCIPEGDETALYIVVERPNGHQYVERMGSRTIPGPTTETETIAGVSTDVDHAAGDISDMVFVDCALGYDGRNTGSATMTLTGTTYAAGDLDSITASVSTFKSSDVGSSIFIYGLSSAGDRVCVHCTITAYVSATKVTVSLDKDATTSLQNVSTTDWAFAVKTVAGLWHLEGEDVAVTGDGWVVANPYNDDYTVLTVSGGQVTLPEAHAVIWVGLPYVSDLRTCDLESGNGPSLMNRNKQVRSVTCYVNDTREFWAGESFPDDDSQEGLKPSRQHVTGEDTDVPPALFSEPIMVNIKSKYNTGGRVCIRNIDPLPCEIIAISPEFQVGS